MERQNIPSRLTLRMQTGVHPESNDPVLRSFSFGNLVPTTSDQVLFNLAQTLANLSSFALRNVLRTDAANLNQG